MPGKRILIVSDSVGTPAHPRGIFHCTTSLMRALKRCGHHVTLLVEDDPSLRVPARESAEIDALSAPAATNARLGAIYHNLSRTGWKNGNMGHSPAGGWWQWAAGRLHLPLSVTPLISLRGVRLKLRLPVVLPANRIANDYRNIDFIPPALDHLRSVAEFLTCESVYTISFAAGMLGFGAPTIDARGYDVILIDTATYLRFKKSPGAEAVAVIHDLIPLSDATMNPRWRRVFLNKLLVTIAECDDFVFDSGVTRNKFAEFFPEAVQGKKGAIFYPSVADEFGGSRSQEPQAGYFAAVVSGDPRKNLDNLVRAFAHLPDGIGLKVIGFLPVNRDAPSRGDNGRIEFLGYVGEAVKSATLAGSKGVIVPSFAEGFGLPIVEGAFFGKPVFCSDIPVFREVAGDNAFYFDPYSPESIAAVIMEYVNDPARYQARTAAAEAECRRRFSLTSLVDAVAARFGRAI